MNVQMGMHTPGLNDGRFCRGLSANCLEALRDGFLRPLFQSLKSASLDIQLRERYLDAYAQGRSVLSLHERDYGTRFLAKIHQKYLDGIELPDGKFGKYYAHYPVTAAFMKAYSEQLPAILANASKYAKPEGTAEEAILQASLCIGAPVLFVDRQVAIPDTGIKADALGWQSTADGGRMIIAEIKQGLDNRIQELMTQMMSYASIMAPDGGLRADLAASYRTVIAQKQALDLLPASLSLPIGILPTTCLFILYDYNPRSELLDRLRLVAKQSTLRTQLILLPKDVYTLPPVTAWEIL